MDLLFKRYADPFSLLNGMIQTGRFCEFIRAFFEKVQNEREEQTSWEYFLHKVWEGSFTEFKESMDNDKKNQELSELDMETTVKNSMDILKNFKPE